MLRLFPAALAIAATVAMASPALAQDQGFTVSLGYFGPTGADGRVNGDVLNADRCIDVTFACEPLLFSVGDFGGFIINGEYVFGLGKFFEASGGVGFYQRTVPSVYSNLTYPDGSEIRQDLKLRTVPITGIVRFVPTGRHASIQPFLGIGIAAINWHYSETGDFVDPSDNTIFSARYVDSGTRADGPQLPRRRRDPLSARGRAAQLGFPGPASRPWRLVILGDDDMEILTVRSAKW
jgi:hypothetical protein